MASAAPQPESALVLYLYGITGEDAGRSGIAAKGIDGVAAIEPHAAAGVLAWVSRVRRADFGEGLQQKMQDLEWLAAASVRHQRAVAEITARGDVLPARFGTVFSSTASLEQHLRQRVRAIGKALQRIRGAEEWGVKIFAEPHAAPAAGTARSGRDYLKKKSEALKSRNARELPPAVDRLARDLGKLAVATAAVGKVSSGQRDLVWQTAVLLRRARSAEFQRLLNKYAAALGQAYRLEATGPWAPYSFSDGQ